VLSDGFVWNADLLARLGDFGWDDRFVVVARWRRS
jgi:hypothetical protein